VWKTVCQYKWSADKKYAPTPAISCVWKSSVGQCDLFREARCVWKCFYWWKHYFLHLNSTSSTDCVHTITLKQILCRLTNSNEKTENNTQCKFTGRRTGYKWQWSIWRTDTRHVAFTSNKPTTVQKHDEHQHINNSTWLDSYNFYLVNSNVFTECIQQRKPRRRGMHSVGDAPNFLSVTWALGSSMREWCTFKNCNCHH